MFGRVLSAMIAGLYPTTGKSRMALLIYHSNPEGPDSAGTSSVSPLQQVMFPQSKQRHLIICGPCGHCFIYRGDQIRFLISGEEGTTSGISFNALATARRGVVTELSPQKSKSTLRVGVRTIRGSACDSAWLAQNVVQPHI